MGKFKIGNIVRLKNAKFIKDLKPATIENYIPIYNIYYLNFGEFGGNDWFLEDMIELINQSKEGKDVMELQVKVGDEMVVNEKVLSDLARNGTPEDDARSMVGKKVKIVRIDPEDCHLPYRVEGDFSFGKHKWVTAESLSPIVIEFKIGDTVEVVNNLRMQFGRIGKIYCIDDSKIPFLVRFSDGYESWFRKLELKLISRKEKTEEQWDGKFLADDTVEIVCPKPSELTKIARDGFAWIAEMDDWIGRQGTIKDAEGDTVQLKEIYFYFPLCALRFISRPEPKKKETPVTLDRFKEAIQRVDWKSQSQLTALLASGIKWFLKTGKDAEVGEGHLECPCCLRFTKEVNCSACSLKQRGDPCCKIYADWNLNRNEENARNLALYIIGKAIEEMEKNNKTI